MQAYKETTFKIFCHYDNLEYHRRLFFGRRKHKRYDYNIEDAEMMSIAQRMFPWFCHFRLCTEIFWLMDNTHCSPFICGKNGLNSLHIMAKQKEQTDLLKLIVSQKYEFFHPQIIGKKFNLVKALTFPDKVERNTAFHISAIHQNPKFFDDLVIYIVDHIQSTSISNEEDIKNMTPSEQ